MTLNQSKLPNLFIPGAGKSGTSSLHNFLNEHPEISMSTVKEPHFWTTPNFEITAEESISDYLNLFGKNAFRGESSTGYLFFKNFIPNIKSVYKETPKFIIVLRNPIDRIYSQYWWLKGLGSEKLPFREAVLQDKDVYPDQSLQLAEQFYKTYFQFGLYAERVQAFYNAFGKENIHIITSENLKNNTLEAVNSCFLFLGLNTLKDITSKNTNTTTQLKFPWIYNNVKKIALNSSAPKRLLKPFFPASVRKKINEGIHPAVYKLTATSKAYPEMTLKDREWLKKSYEKNVSELKEITGFSFEEWTDFN